MQHNPCDEKERYDLRITNFVAVVDDDNRTMLVKESSKNYQGYDNINRPENVAALMRDVYELDKQAVEFVYMLALNSQGKILGVYMVSKGTVNNSVLSSREIYMVALMLGAVNIILVHNHPSGDCTPSRDDINSSQRIKEAGSLLGINLLDHIIVGNNHYCSLDATGLL